MTQDERLLPIIIKVGDDFELHAGDLVMPKDGLPGAEESFRAALATTLHCAAAIVERMRTSHERLRDEFGKGQAGAGSAP
jgi:hypothetical protein